MRVVPCSLGRRVQAKLVIELDGGQHYALVGRKRDERRDAYLQSLGLSVIRFSDREVLLQNPHPRPLLFKERGVRLEYKHGGSHNPS
ncbi:MAG: DUF559 domain-containing protein [Nitrospiraceae bacterium]